MDSPVKKLNFEASGKENLPYDAQVLAVPEVEIKKPVEDVKAVVVAPTIKPEEADEPLLQETPQRFVLFPIKYHEVCTVVVRVIDASRVKSPHS